MSVEQGDVEAVRAALDLSDLRSRTDPIFYTSALAALDRLAAALERAERERDRFLAGNQKLLDGQIRLAKRAEKAERALAEIADYIEAEFREGDKPYQVAIIARAALRPSEEASDE